MKKRKKQFWLLIPVFLVLCAGIVLGLCYGNAQKTFTKTMDELEQDGFSAYQSAEDAKAVLSKNPFGRTLKEQIESRQEELLLAETERNIQEGNLDAAEKLLDEYQFSGEQEARAKLEAKRSVEETYAKATMLEQENRLEEALELFRLIPDYLDAAEHAETLQTRIAFEAAKDVFTGSNYDEAIEAMIALGTEEGDAAAQKLMEQKTVWKAETAANLIARAEGLVSAGAWHSAVAGDTPGIYGDARYGSAPEHTDRVYSGLTSIFFVLDGRVITAGETFGEPETIASMTRIRKIAPGLNHALFLTEEIIC